MYVLSVNNNNAFSKCEITASQAELNSSHNALKFDAAKTAGLGFERPGASAPVRSFNQIFRPEIP